MALTDMEYKPVIVDSHLPHDLAVDLIPQNLILHRRAKDLVSQLQGATHLLYRVIAHIFQDRYRDSQEKN